MLLAALEQLEAQAEAATYIVLRRKIPRIIASHTWSAKEAILSALAALVEDGYLEHTAAGTWVTSARWRFWRSIFRSESPSG
jgi:hypothetical protein